MNAREVHEIWNRADRVNRAWDRAWLVLALIGALCVAVASTARATLKVVGLGAIGQPASYGPDGVARPLLTITHNSISVAMAAAVAGDTIYVLPGSYDQEITTSAPNCWPVSNLIVTGIRVNPYLQGFGELPMMHRAELRDTDGGTTVTLPRGVGGGAADITGCGIEFMRIERASAGGAGSILIHTNGARQFTFKSVKFEGTTRYVLLQGAGNNTPMSKDIYFTEACSLGASGSNPTEHPFQFSADGANNRQWSVDGLYISDSILDFRNFTFTGTVGNSACIYLEAVRRVEVSRTDIYVGNNARTGDGDGFTGESPLFGFAILSNPCISGAFGWWSKSDSILFDDVDVYDEDDANASNDHAVMMGFVGWPSTRRGVNNHNILLRDVRFHGPATTANETHYNGFKSEAIWSHADGDSAQKFNNGLVFDRCSFDGQLRLAIGLQENTRYAKILDTVAINDDNASANSYAAFVFGGARHSIIAGCYTRGYQAGIGHDWGGVSTALYSYGNAAIGNVFDGPRAAYYIDLTGAALARPDSAFTSAGNVLVNGDKWALEWTGGETLRDITWWRTAYPINATYVNGNGLTITGVRGGRGSTSLGDRNWSELRDSSKGVGTLPYRTLRPMGSAKIGVQ